MAETGFSYDVFISYKSEQESWALRLADTLTGFGLTVWRDHDARHGLRAGQRWGPAIENAIHGSRTMLVLWSEALRSDATSVAHQEIAEMDRLVRSEAAGTRSFLPVKLDAEPVERHGILGKFQAAEGFAELFLEHGSDQAHLASSVRWAQAVKGVAEALGVKRIVELRFVVAAMNRSQAEALERDPKNLARESQAYHGLRQMMEATRSLGPERYGDSPDDWKPFPQLEEHSILKLIQRYDVAKRHWLRDGGRLARWILVSYSQEVLSEDPDRRRAAAQELLEGPCLVVVDPYSLYHKDVFQRIMVDVAIQSHKEAYVIGISPYILYLHDAVNTEIGEVELSLQNLFGPAYSHFEKSFESHSRFCVLGIDHELQFARWLQVAGDRICSANKTLVRRFPRYREPRLRRKGSRRGPSSTIFQMGRDSS